MNERNGVRQSQALPGHATEGMTSHDVRHKSGTLTCPTCSESELGNRQDQPARAEKCLALVQQARTISENSTGLAGGSPLGFDFSIDVFED